MTIINRRIVPFVTIIQFAALKGHHRGNETCAASSCLGLDGSVTISSLIFRNHPRRKSSHRSRRGEKSLFEENNYVSTSQAPSNHFDPCHPDDLVLRICPTARLGTGANRAPAVVQAEPSSNQGSFRPVSYSLPGNKESGSYVPGTEADTIGVFRAGTWYLKNANDDTGADIGPSYGLPGDQPVTGDWNGDGITTLGVYRNGTFSLRNSNTSGTADIGFNFNPTGNSSGAQPLAGDWDGDGIDTIGIYQNGAFYLRNSNNDGPANYGFSLGISGDIAITGDWDNNGTDTTGIFRRSEGKFYLRYSNDQGFADFSFYFGAAGTAYQPLAGDWNSDGFDTIGLVYNGIFYLRNSNTSGIADVSVAFGNPGDMPVAGNWDGIPSMLPPTPTPSPHAGGSSCFECFFHL